MNRIKEWISWILVSLCILAIFLVVPAARSIQNFVSVRWGRSLFGYSVLAVTFLAFLILLYVLIFRLKIRSPSNYVWLSLIAVLYFYFTLKLWEAPEEAIHFLEYGLLGYFLFRALSLRIKSKTIYLVAILIGSLVGTFDEILQWIVPKRYWDLRDVGLNVLSGILFQIALWKGIKPKIISEKIKPKSIRTASVLLGANLVLLGLCMSNTPQRVVRYTKLLPAFSSLQKEESMSEFGRKHKDPEIGIFYSRLTLDELEETDKKMSDEYARILKEWKDREYEKFLRDFSPSTHPFVHELRVHVFRRDKKFDEGRQTKDGQKKKELFFIAYKENLILQKYFRCTIQKSIYKWDDEKIEETESFIDKSRTYVSPVSSGLFTSIGERTMWLAILIFLVGLTFFNLWIVPKLFN